MTEKHNPDAVVKNERVLAFAPEQVFKAFEQPELLAQWWGPNGFSNTFTEFDFKAGGRWSFVMHGPNGGNYDNESFFLELLPGEKIVIHHVSPPRFILTITLKVQGNGTHLTWEQEFESVELATKMRNLSQTANEENLNRLETVLSGQTP